MGVTAAVGAVVDTLGVAGTAAAGAAIGAGVAAATGGNALQGALMGGTVGFGGAELAGAAGLTGGVTSAAVSTADSTAVGMGYTSAADAIANSGGAITAETLGLPAGTSLAQLAAATGSASAGFLGTDAGAEALAGAGINPATGLPWQSTGSGLAAGAGQTVSPSTGGLSSLLAGAGSSGSTTGLIGGLGNIAQGAMALSTAGKLGQLQKQSAPMSQYQPALASQLYGLLSNPNTVTTTPGYQFNLQQGLQAQQASQAAKGNLVSGGALLQANQYGQQYAQSSLAQQEAMLANLASQAPSQATTAANLLGSQQSATVGGLSNLASGLTSVANPLATLYSNYNS
jgi:hypothetical protein